MESKMAATLDCPEGGVELNPEDTKALMGYATECWKLKDYENCLVFCKMVLLKEDSAECLELLLKCLLLFGSQYTLGPPWMWLFPGENHMDSDGGELDGQEQLVVLDTWQRNPTEEYALCADFDAALTLDSSSSPELEDTAIDVDREKPSDAESAICIDDSEDETESVILLDVCENNEGNGENATSAPSRDIQLPECFTKYRRLMENFERISASARKSRYAGASSIPKTVRRLPEESPVPSKVRKMDRRQGAPVHHYQYDRRMYHNYEQHRGNVQKMLVPGMKRSYEDRYERKSGSSVTFMFPDPTPERGPRRQMLLDPTPERGPRRQMLLDPTPERGPRRQMLPDPTPERGPRRQMLPDHHHPHPLPPVGYALIPPGEHRSRPRSRAGSLQYRFIESCPHCLSTLPGYTLPTAYHRGFEQEEYQMRSDPLFEPDMYGYLQRRPASPPHMLFECHHRHPTVGNRSMSPVKHGSNDWSTHRRRPLSRYCPCAKCHHAYKTKERRERYGDKMFERDRYSRHPSNMPPFEHLVKPAGEHRSHYRSPSGSHRNRSIEMTMRFRVPKPSPIMK